MFTRRLRTAFRSPAQGLIEYGLIVAVVAFAAMMGLSHVSNAEEALLNGSQLAPAPPAAGFSLHSTQTNVTCPLTTFVADNITYIDCTAEVDDTYGTPGSRLAPDGTVEWVLDSTVIATCAPHISPVSSYGATCALHYLIPAALAVKTNYSLTARYSVQLTNHQFSQSTPATPIVIYPKPGFTISCVNPYIGGVGPHHSAAPGQPLQCGVAVTNTLTTTPLAGFTVTLNATGTSGFPFFSCAAMDNLAATGGGVNDPGCTPSATWTCVTDATGVCISYPGSTMAGKDHFLYRRTPDDNAAISSSDGIVASVTFAAGVTQTSAPYPLTITAPVAHNTGVILSCGPVDRTGFDNNVQALFRLNTPPLPFHIKSDVNYAKALAAIPMRCSAAEMDLSANTTFDAPACQVPSPGPLDCHTDYVAAYAPLGTVQLSITTNSGPPPTTSQVSCLLGAGAGRPPLDYLLQQPVGQIRYASWCSLPQIDVPQDMSWNFIATYIAPTSGHNPTPGGGPSTFSGFAAPTLHVDTT